MTTKLLALDVEGTLIPTYDFDHPRSDDSFPAKIHKSIANSLMRLQKLDFTIVLATGTEGKQLTIYQNEFAQHGLAKYITAYKPKNHNKNDSKHDKLQKYSEQYKTPAADIYFYDDAASNVQAAIKNGFANSFQVSDKLPLHVQLHRLASRLEAGAVDSLYHLYRSDRCGGGRFRANTIFYTLFGSPKPLATVTQTLKQRADSNPGGASHQLIYLTS